LEDGLHLGILAKRATIFLLPIALAACAGSDDGRSMSLSADRNDTNPPAPTEYRPQLLAFMKTYLRNPVGVQYAEIAEPMQRSVDGRPGYVICLRFNSREIDGSYRGIRERAIVYVNGRLDHVIENTGETCAGVVYAPFPELEKMSR
jgi:hypothetical protein